MVFKYFPLRLFTRCREIKRSPPAAVPDSSLSGSSKTAAPVRGRWAAYAPHVEPAEGHGVCGLRLRKRTLRPIQPRPDKPNLSAVLLQKALHSPEMSGHERQRKTWQCSRGKETKQTRQKCSARPQSVLCQGERAVQDTPGSRRRRGWWLMVAGMRPPSELREPASLHCLPGEEQFRKHMTRTRTEKGREGQ